MNVRALVTTNVPDANGVYTQRIYEVDSTPYSYYFRIPLAGNPTADLPNSLSWNGQDAVQVENSPQYLGSYDGSSWQENADGNLQVSYFNGDYCYGVFTYRSSVVVFACSNNANETITIEERRTCMCT